MAAGYHCLFMMHPAALPFSKPRITSGQGHYTPYEAFRPHQRRNLRKCQTDRASACTEIQDVSLGLLTENSDSGPVFALSPSPKMYPNCSGCNRCNAAVERRNAGSSNRSISVKAPKQLPTPRDQLINLARSHYRIHDAYLSLSLLVLHSRKRESPH